jgi:selenocysteine-specific elongation factor
MNNVVMGTAGHVDHGKTTLIEALTGINCDRLSEEKEREITIDIGFAHMPPGGGRAIGIVDVPGHERFIKNMLAGVAGIDFVLLVIAADDGVMPQTKEHLDICNLLRIQKGVVAITKIDLVEPEWVEMIVRDVREAVRGTFLDGAAFIPVSSQTGQGLVELADEIRKVADSVRPRNEWGPVRLHIDRSFTIKGAGTVVTGTLISGTLRPDMDFVLLPGDREVRVRQIQVHGVKKSEAAAGQRCAVNLAGMDAGEIQRGDVLAESGYLDTTNVIDVKIKTISGLKKPIRNRSRIRFHIGTQEIIGRIGLHCGEELNSNGEGYARLRFESPAVCAYGDLFIIRTFSPMSTAGGGIVLDARPNLRRRTREQIVDEMARREKGAPEELVAQAAADFGFTAASVKEISARINQDPADVARIVASLVEKGAVLLLQDKGRVITRSALENIKLLIIKRMNEYFAAQPKRTWVSIQELKTKYFGKIENKVFEFAITRMSEEGRFAVSVSRRGYRPFEGSDDVLSEEKRIRHAIEEIFDEGGINPPGPQDIIEKVRSGLLDVQEVFQVLVDSGAIVKLGQNAYLKMETIAAAREKILLHLKCNGEITVGEAKVLFGASRKIIIPLMEYFDSTGVTLRDGDKRLPHPKQKTADLF